MCRWDVELGADGGDRGVGPGDELEGVGDAGLAVGSSCAVRKFRALGIVFVGPSVGSPGDGDGHQFLLERSYSKMANATTGRMK